MGLTYKSCKIKSLEDSFNINKKEKLIMLSHSLEIPIQEKVQYLIILQD